MMKDTATVLLCHDMTRRSKKQSVFGIIISNTRGSGANVEPAQHNQSTLPQRNSEVVLSPDFGQIRRWAVIEMGLEDIHVENL